MRRFRLAYGFVAVLVFTFLLGYSYGNPHGDEPWWGSWAWRVYIGGVLLLETWTHRHALSRRVRRPRRRRAS